MAKSFVVCYYSVFYLWVSVTLSFISSVLLFISMKMKRIQILVMSGRAGSVNKQRVFYVFHFLPPYFGPGTE